MTLMVTLPEDLAARAAAEADRRGISVDQVVAEALATRLSETLSAPATRRHLAFAGIGASTSGKNAADAEDLLAEGFGRD
ncbi:MAG: hypothetical protein ACYDH5_14685 [Acidimicrobiales bacterium]